MADEKVYVDESGLTLYNSLIRGDTTPQMDGTGATGTSKKFARADHVHPKDTSKVDKVDGKGLSTNDFTDALLNKLNGIASGAEVNVQSDWNQTDDDEDDFIKNKPTLPVGSNEVPLMDGTGASGSSADFSRADHVHPSDTSKVDKVTGKGLSTNDFTDAFKTKLEGIATGAEVNVQSDWNQTNSGADDFIKNKPDVVLTSSKGQPNGVCDLDSTGLIPSSRLPSYVDDVVESYPVSGATELSAGWLSLASGGSAFTPESGKIYTLMEDSVSYKANSQFRWGGTVYVKLNDGGIRPITTAEIEAIVNS